MQNLLNNIITYLKEIGAGEKSLGFGGRLFSRVFYLWLLIIGVLCWPILDITFGENSYTYRSAMAPSLRYNLIYILTYQPHLYKLVYMGFMSGSALAFFNLGGVIVRFVVWISLVILAKSAYLVFNAGTMLAYNYAFFLIFLFPKPRKDWMVVFSNFSIIGLRVQFLVVYIFAALYKWMEADWIGGDAVHFLSMIDHFTPEWLFLALQRMPGALVTLNYLVLFYLTLFPILVWFRKLKLYLFIVGAGFHIYTMVFMNLFDFGSIMILSYLLFVPSKWLEWLKKTANIF